MKKIYLLLITLLFVNLMQAQTNLISPTGDGGFENGGTPLANGWTVVNGSPDSWVVGAVPVVSAGSNCGYITSTPNTTNTWTYSQFSTIQHMYRDITIPAGEGVANLTFKWKVGGEGVTISDWDNMKVFLAPTSVTPTLATPILATYQISGPGAVSGMYKLSSTSYNSESILTSVTPGTSYRLIFSWKSDVSTVANPPAAIDEISLNTRAANSISSNSIGGLWSSPATWVGGLVPNGDDAVIADGATVTIDQIVNVRDLTIGGGTSGSLHWNATANALNANRNILINSGANLNMFTAAAVHPGVQINIAGNFTNNGTVHSAMAGAILNFNSLTSSTPSNLDGIGTFVGGIIGQLVNASTGGVTINTTQNIVTRLIVHTAGALNTNGKLSLDNTATIFGASFNQKIYSVVVTGMGTGYNSATPPIITIAAPNAGTTATAIPNIDDATGTLRSITITNAGDGYTSNPVVTITGGTGSGASAVAVNNRFSSGLVASSIQKSGAATITGGINIRSQQSVGALASSSGLGVGYTSAPSIGFPLPFGYQNLVTSGGSGYTSLPTITVSGGTSLPGVTNPTFTVVVAQGRVVSVIAATGGSQWTSQPTLTITGGAGSGATAAYPTSSLATATATISNGAINGYTVTNGGLGYTAAPTPTLVGGGFTTTAVTFSAVALYNLTLNFFAPAATNAPHTETGLIPINRRINTLIVSNAVSGSAFTGDVEVYSSTALTLTTSILNLGSNTLFASHPAYAGVTGSVTNNISGNIRLSTPGGSLTRTFPFDAPFVAVMGTGSLVTGSTVTSLTVSRTGSPSGAVSPSGNTTGTRAYRVVTNAGALYGTSPTVTMNYNATDALVADNPTLFIGQSAALTGPWINRSATSGTGNLSTTGSRTTATTTPGPIVPTGDDYYAWTTTFVAPACAIPTSVATNTVTFNSANVTFTSTGSSFIVEYGLSGFTPGLGSTAGTGGTVVTGTGSPISLTGLTEGTQYSVYVRQDCTTSNNGFSPNSTLITFTTLYNCGALLTLTCGLSVTTGNLAQAGGLYSVTSCGFTTPGREKIYTFTSTTAGTYTLNITGVNGGTGFNDYFFKIADGNCNLNTGWTCIKDLSAVSVTPFTLAANTTYYMLVDAESAASTANHTFQIDCPPACPAPTSVAVPGGTITTNSANVTFTGAGNLYIAEYGLTGFTPGTGATAGTGGTIVTGTSSPITLPGLTASTAYQVYVRQDCTGANNGYSTNSGPVAFTTASPTITSISSGLWNNGSTWNTNVVPACTDLVIIANTHTVSVSSSGNVSRAINIQTGGTLSVNSGDVIVGCTSNNSSLTNNGTLTLTGGLLTVNGNVSIASGATFNQSAGDIIIDPNSGTAGTSVASGTTTFLINSNLGLVTGGTIKIVDPNFNISGKAFDYNVGSSLGWATGHTLIIGDPASLNSSANTSGFILEQYTGSGKLAIGNLVIDGGAGTNKQASLGAWSTFVNGNLTVNANSFFTIGAVSAGAVITGNVTNNGTITQSAASGLILAATTGTTTVVNPNPQTIGGAGIYRNLATTPTAELNTLTINNSSAAGVNIATPLRISGTLTLTAGVVNTTLTNILTVGFNGTNVGTLNFTAGRVNGPLKRWISAATGARAFPVGNATLSKNASLNFTIAPTTAGTLTAFFSSTAPLFSNVSQLTEGALIINTLSKQGSWFVDAADGLAGGTYTPTFTGTGTNDIVDFTKTVLVKRPSTGGDWILEGIHITTTGSNTAPVLSRSGMAGFSEFAIGGENNAVLPVTIEFFRGSKQATSNILDWKVTCTAEPSVFISLERSADGRSFKSLQDQTATAARCLQGFNYVDATPLAGYNYYRLKTVTLNGKVKFSTIVVLLNKEKGFELISIAPNPVQNTAILSLTTVKGGKIEISVSDVSGKIISKQSTIVIAGNNPINMNLASLSAGTYIIIAVNAEGEMKTTRFVKL